MGLGTEAQSVCKEDDFYAWLLDQALQLRARRYELVDWEGLAEEIEAMAARERRELVSRLRILLAHLLKWQYQSRRRGENSWKRSIVVSRQEISELLGDSPSLLATRAEHLLKAYLQARRLAGTEMRLSKLEWESQFPAACPWTFEQVMDQDFMPSERKEPSA
jgi:hypothetical protein